MDQRREEGFFGDVLQLLVMAPWWAGPLLTGACYAFLRYVIPAILVAKRPSPQPDAVDASWVLEPLLTFPVVIAPFIAGFVLLIWLVALVKKAEAAKTANRRTKR